MKEKMTHFLVKRTSIALLMGILGIGLGCAGPQKKSVALDRAREAYFGARSNPQVVANAPVALNEAAQTLKEAEQAEDEKEQSYFAYLAQRRAEIAVALAERKEAEKQIAALNKEKSQVLLEARQKEAERSAAAAKSAQSQAEKAQREAQEKARENVQLKEELSQLKAKQTERGMAITLSDILFEFDRSDLTPDGRRIVDQLASILQRYPERNVLIEGFTDSIGTPEYNLRLSKRRADSVVDRLLADGINAGRITMRAYGENHPVATNDTYAGRQLNRRVEITVLNPGVRDEALSR